LYVLPPFHWPPVRLTVDFYLQHLQHTSTAISHRYYQTLILVWSKCRWKRPSDSPFGIQKHQWNGPRHRLPARAQSDSVPTVECSTYPCSTSCTAGESSSGRSEILCRSQIHTLPVICSTVLIICDSAICARRTGHWSRGTLSSGTSLQSNLDR
jgi:hypothetical protein